MYDGKDVIGQARTGTGKTLSFVLPLLERIEAEDLVKPRRGRPPFVLVMAPTRELANQVYQELVAVSSEGVASHCVYGGTAYAPQELAIRNGLDVLVGTPGRILDHMRRGLLNLDHLRYIYYMYYILVIASASDRLIFKWLLDTVRIYYRVFEYSRQLRCPINSKVE